MSTTVGSPQASTPGKSRGPGRPRFLIGALGAAIALLLAGCGTSSSGSTSGTTTPAQLDAAHAAVADASKLVTDLPITTPLKSKPAPGKTIVDLRCDSVQCTNFDTALMEATAATGWQLKTIPFKNSDPSTLTAAMQDALRFNPAAVILPGADPKLWASMVPTYESAKVPLIALSITGLPKMSSPLVAVGSEPFFERQASMIANWFIGDSQGKGKALLLTIPAYPLFNTMTAQFEKTVAAGCGGCQVKRLELTIPQLANQQIPTIVASELRKDPSINYVIPLVGTLVQGVPSQLQAAGLAGKVTIAGGLASQDNMADILAGRVKMVTSQAMYVTGWMAMDAVLRLAEGSSLPTDSYAAGAPIQLLDKDNVGVPSPSWDSPKDYVAQFKKLWHIG